MPAVLERRLAAHLADLEHRVEGKSANRARELHQETTDMSAPAAGFGRFPASLEQGDAQTIAETLVDAYLDGAENSDDPGRLEFLAGARGARDRPPGLAAGVDVNSF